MEIWDLYDRDGKKTGETWERKPGNFLSIPEGRYHLVVDILIKHVDGTYLLTKRHPDKDVYPGYWEASAGGSALCGENPLDAAKREMKEETGLFCDELKLINVSFSDRSHSMFYSYLTVVDCDKGSVILQEGETVDYKWVDKEGIVDYMDSPYSVKTHNDRYKTLFDEYKTDIKNRKVLLFDLDGTLLRSDKTISEKTLLVVKRCKNEGYYIGISTSRSEGNSRKFIDSLDPDIIISSAGAMVSFGKKTVFSEGFSGDETYDTIEKARQICGDLNISVDTLGDNAEYYRNFIPPQNELEGSWGSSIDTDFKDFRKPSLKICFEIANEDLAKQLKDKLTECDFIHFTDGDWYKVTKAGITKETAINKLCEYLKISIKDITAFGDDLADIGMLKICGTGVAMGNAVEQVKQAADITIGSNDDDGIAVYLEGILNKI